MRQTGGGRGDDAAAGGAHDVRARRRFPRVEPTAARVAVVTGVSRRAGIGFAIARRLLEDGMSALIHSWAAHDAGHEWAPGPDELQATIGELGGLGPRLAHVEADLADPEAPRRVIEAARERFGAVDVLVANHARSARGTLDAVTAAELDLCWAVNARASVLLTQAFAGVHDDSRPDGRVVLFTSGQHRGPMSGELPYAISKGAIHQMTASLADALAERAITVNAVNPGPVDTGWPTAELRELLRPAFPTGRWGEPTDIAAVVSAIASPDFGWVTGQVIDAEGGFRRG
jgi:3-oxoacyl-[acyl-carrier protein] reductase